MANKRQRRQLRTAVLFRSDTSPAIALSAPISGDVPRQRFRKELIRTGRYVKDSDGIDFEVTRDDHDPKARKFSLAHWVAEFGRMKAAGVKVTLPEDHDGAGQAGKNHGSVVDLFAEGDSLVAVIDVVGERGIELAAKNDVSIYVPPSTPDGKGGQFTRAIEHVALTPTPVIPGLGDWQAIAASRTPTRKEPTMPIQWEEIQKAIGAAEKLTDATAPPLILSHVTATAKTIQDLTAERDKFKADAESHKAEVLKLSKDPPREPTAMELELAGENRALKLAKLVDEAKITPAAAAKIKARWVDATALKLSLSRNGTDDGFKELVDALADNDPVSLGEKSGMQVVSLSWDHAKGGAESPLVANAKRRAEAAKTA